MAFSVARLAPIPAAWPSKMDRDKVARWKQVRHDGGLVEVVDGNEGVVVAETWVVSRRGLKQRSNILYQSIYTRLYCEEIHNECERNVPSIGDDALSSICLSKVGSKSETYAN